jgi:hypoxanthine phosphoribosyltransferase
MLQVEVYPVRVSRRVQDVVTYQEPRWLVEPPAVVKGRRVLVVDEISSSGETIVIVKQKVAAMGAQAVRSAVLYAHGKGVSVPDYIGLISDDLLLNPWDREILREGQFQVHPEYVGALAEQGVVADESWMIEAPMVEAAKNRQD